MAEPTVERRRAGATRQTREAPRARRGSVPRDRRAVVRESALRLSPYLIVLGAIVLVVVGQLAEDLADSEPLQLLAPLSAIRRWTLIVAVVYMLVISRVIDRLVERSLVVLDALVQVDPDHFQEYAAWMRRPSFALDAGLVIASAAIVTVIFWVLQTSLPIDDPVTNAPLFLPGSSLGAVAVLVQYTLVGWAVLTLVWCTIRRARALGQLSQEPLEVDVFDTSNVLPLGTIALATALAPAGVIVILLFGFGRPSSPVSWSLLVLVTLASLVALLLPLRGVHRQMETAKEAALSRLNARMRDSYEQASAAASPSAEETTRLNHRVSTLVNLRKTVGEMTTWPFRDTLAFGRAVLIATAPLIYTVINELIKIFFINPLAG